MANDDEASSELPTGSRLTALDEAFRSDPYVILNRLRSRDPIHRDEELKRWFITDHDLVREVLRDKGFCVDARKALENSFARQIAGSGADAEAPSMLGLDDPDHRRLRSFVSRAFAPKAVEVLRPKVEQIVEEVLAPLRGVPASMSSPNTEARSPFGCWRACSASRLRTRVASGGGPRAKCRRSIPSGPTKPPRG